MRESLGRLDYNEVRSVDAEADRQDAELRDAVINARCVKDEVDRFVRTWPDEAGEEMAPGFSWEGLARQLKDLAGSPAQAGLVDGLLLPIRRWAACKPPELVLRELLCLAFILLNEDQAAAPASSRGAGLVQPFEVLACQAQGRGGD